MSNIKAVQEVFRFFERCQSAERHGGISPATLQESLGSLLGDGIDRQQLQFFLKDLTDGLGPHSKLHIREVVQCLEQWFNNKDAASPGYGHGDISVHSPPLPRRSKARRDDHPSPIRSPKASTRQPQSPTGSPHQRDTEKGSRAKGRVQAKQKTERGGGREELRDPPTTAAAAPLSPAGKGDETPRPVLRERCSRLEEELGATRAAVRQLLQKNPTDGPPSPSTAARDLLAGVSGGGSRGSTAGQVAKEDEGEYVPNTYTQRHILRMHKAAAKPGGREQQQQPLKDAYERGMGPTEREEELLKQVVSLQEQVQMGQVESQGLEMLLAEERRTVARTSEAATRAVQGKVELDRRFAERGTVLETLNMSFKVMHEQLERTVGAAALGADAIRAATESLQPMAGAAMGLENLVEGVEALEEQVSRLTERLEEETRTRKAAEATSARLRAEGSAARAECDRLTAALEDARAECASARDRASAEAAGAERAHAAAALARNALAAEQQDARRRVTEGAVGHPKATEALSERRPGEMESAVRRKLEEARMIGLGSPRRDGWPSRPSENSPLNSTPPDPGSLLMSPPSARRMSLQLLEDARERLAQLNNSRGSPRSPLVTTQLRSTPVSPNSALGAPYSPPGEKSGMAQSLRSTAVSPRSAIGAPYSPGEKSQGMSHLRSTAVSPRSALGAPYSRGEKSQGVTQLRSTAAVSSRSAPGAPCSPPGERPSPGMASRLDVVARSATAVQEGIENLDRVLEQWAAVLPGVVTVYTV